MPFKSVKKRRAYAKKWRRTHPTYMRNYGRKYYALGMRKPKPATEVAMMEVT